MSTEDELRERAEKKARVEQGTFTEHPLSHEEQERIKREFDES